MRREAAAGAVVIAMFLAVGSASTMSEAMAEPIVKDAETSANAASQPAEVVDAIGRFKVRDFDGALKLLREAGKKNADVPPAQVVMAQLFLQANIPMGARNALEKAVMENPAEPDAYVLIGDLAMREGRVTEAELAYQKAESLMPKFDKSAKRKDFLQANTYSGLAAVSEARENWAESQRQLEAWLKLDPNSPLAMQRLARCLVHQNNLTDALQTLKRSAKIDPGMLTPEAILAQFCEEVGDRENAKKYVASALAAAPKDLRTRLFAARWAFETGQLEEAKTHAAAAAKLDEKSLDAKILRGMIAASQKDNRAAESYFEQAYLQSPDNFVASNQLALVLAEQKDDTKKRRALDYAEANVKKFPKSGDAIATYGWTLYKLGRLEEADKALRAAVSSGSYNADTLYYLARLDVDRDQGSEAELLLQSALKRPGAFMMRSEAKALLEQLKK